MSDLTFKNFVLLDENEKKLVLEWRNSDRIRLKMNNQEIISIENHLKWIEALKNRTDCVYYLFYVDDVPIGVFDFTSIDRINKTCLGGSYIGNEEFIGYGIVQCLYSSNFCFNKLKMDKVFANVLKLNKRVYKMHKQIFNATDIKENENEYFICWDKISWQRNISDMENRIKEIYNIERVNWLH